jgi:type II secretory ATPase GspE/PulE/Tfp pilus assembly ATPase PilB-like protein
MQQIVSSIAARRFSIMSDSIFDDLQIAASIQWPAPARNMRELEEAAMQLGVVPVLSLRQSLAQLQLLDDDMLDVLQRERPELLRNKSSELVNHFFVAPEELHHALSRMAGLPEVDAEHFEIAPDAFDVISMQMARMHDVVPLGRHADRFLVASYNPTNEGLQNYLCFMTGHTVRMVWSSKESIDARLGKHNTLQSHHVPPLLDALDSQFTPSHFNHSSFSHSSFKSSDPTSETTPENELTMDGVVSQAVLEMGPLQDFEQATSSSESAGVVRLVKMMIKEARDSGASDIHIETNPGDHVTRVRIRRDGQLRTYLELPSKLRNALVSRIKVMAKLDISEKRRPQDGKINFNDFGGGKVELRVAVLPTHDGLEDVVLRLLESQKPLPLTSLGMQPRDIVTLSRITAHTYGLLLAAGPTGSGKTTTLHSILEDINDDTRKFWTAEDPIEITQPGLRQVQVNPKIGFTFAAAMRSFLRADPDVIMIGEIRDEETAQIAVEASLTGHLVLSTLHTNTAAESVVRLLDLGVGPMHFADSLLGVISQRLVRTLCKHCSKPYYLAPGHFEPLVEEYIAGSPLSHEEGRRRLLEAAGVEAHDKIVVRTPEGCQLCDNTGYRGRIGVYEIMETNADIRNLVQSRARPPEIFHAAIKNGMRSLRHDALEKFVQGRIDLKHAKMAYM